MAKEVQIDIVLKSADAANSLKDIKTALKEVNNEIINTKEGSAEFNKLTAAAGQLKDKINDLNDSLKLTQGSGLERFKNSLGQIKEGLFNLDFGKVKAGIGGATQAFGGLGKAILATGIGALVLGIVQLIANFDELKKAGGLVGAVFTAIGAVVSTITDAIIGLSNAWGLTAIKNTEATDALKGYKKEAADLNSSINDAVINQELLNGTIEEGEAKRRLAKEKSERLERQAEADRDAAIKAAEEGDKKLTEAAIDNALSVFENSKKLIELQYTNELITITNGEAANAKAKADALKKANDAAAKARADEAKRIADEERKNLEIIRKINEEFLRGEQDRLIKERDIKLNTIKGNTLEAERAREKVIQEYAPKIFAASIKPIDDLKLTIKETPIPPLEVQVDTSTAEENLQVFAERLSEALQLYGQQTIDLFAGISSIIADNRASDLEIEATNLEARYQRQKAFIEKNVKDETDRANQLRNLDININNSRNQIERSRIELEKKGIKRQRNIALAEIALNTGIAIAKAVAAADKSNPVTFIATIATNVIAAIAAITKAKNALKQADAASAAIGAGGGGGGVDLPSAASATASATSAAQVPNQFALFGTGGSSNNLGNQNQTQIIQAYVVESDISATQRRVNRFRTASEL
jgi:hypothetical protein